MIGNQEYIKFKVVIVVRRLKEYLQFDVEVWFVILTLEYVYIGVLAKKSISYNAINYEINAIISNVRVLTVSMVTKWYFKCPFTSLLLCFEEKLR